MKKIILGLLVSTFMFFGMSDAILLDFVNLNIQGLADRFSSVHFAGPGNSFGGAFFWLPSKSLPIPQQVNLNGETVNCYKQVRGLYYNSQRGERIWPLDVYTLEMLENYNSSYGQLDLAGGLYSTCDIDPYSIFGQIEFDLDGTMSHLMGGVEVDYNNNRFTGHLKNNLQYFNNELPLGYVLDSLGGMGFVGGFLTGDGVVSTTGHECLTCMTNGNCDLFPQCISAGCSGTGINDFFEYSGSAIVADEDCNFTITGVTFAGGPQRGISIQGKVGLSWTLENIERQALLGNQDKAVLLSTPSITSSTLINKSRKISNDLCRGRPNYTSTILPNSDDVVFCFTYPTYLNTNTLTINLSDINSYQGKTIIVKNANVILENSMANGGDYLDIFVDNGNVILQNNPVNLQWFDGKGYLDSALSGVTQGLLLQGNFILNGLIIAKTADLTSFDHKLYFQGKLHTHNTPISPNVGKVNQIESLFGTDMFADWISLQSIFSWYCNPATGSGSDGVPCFDDPLAESPIVIIDRVFPSRLF